MEWALPLVLGALTLFYICQPLRSGASAGGRKAQAEGWHSFEQLEIDRDLGKIDEAEFEELQHRVLISVPLPAVSSKNPDTLETLILGARRDKRLQIALESEVLIARVRKRGHN